MPTMGLPASRPRRSIEDYYRIENDATAKHEFRDGEILAMSGGSPEHAAIALRLGAALLNRLQGKPCVPYGSGLRVRVTGRSRTAYPDVTVISGKIDYDRDDKAGHTVLNPRLTAEVLSPSTEAYDRGDKFAAYREVPSLAEYVLVSYAEPRIETFLRQADGTWALSSFSGMDATATLRSLQIEVPLAEVYVGVEFPIAPEPPAE